MIKSNSQHFGQLSGFPYQNYSKIDPDPPSDPRAPLSYCRIVLIFAEKCSVYVSFVITIGRRFSSVCGPLVPIRNLDVLHLVSRIGMQVLALCSEAPLRLIQVQSVSTSSRVADRHHHHRIFVVCVCRRRRPSHRK